MIHPHLLYRFINQKIFHYLYAERKKGFSMVRKSKFESALKAKVALETTP